MRAHACVYCGQEYPQTFACRLIDEDNPEQWVQVIVCDACWRSFERLHQHRLQQAERRLLAAWGALTEETA